jgi:hypothetical protein
MRRVLHSVGGWQHRVHNVASLYGGDGDGKKIHKNQRSKSIPH